MAESPDDATFGVVALSSRGDTAWSRRYAYVPRPLERERADSVWNALYPILSREGHTEAEIREALFIPDSYPPVSAALAGLDGSLWIRREDAWAPPHEPNPGAQRVEYQVIAPGGAVIAALSVPANVKLMAASDRHAWGVELDVFDVPTIVRFRIQKHP